MSAITETSQQKAARINLEFRLPEEPWTWDDYVLAWGVGLSVAYAVVSFAVAFLASWGVFVNAWRW